MANVDAPRGFRFLRSLSGGETRLEEAIVTTGQIIYRGDAIKLVDAGTVEEADTDDGVAVIGVASGWVDDSASAGGKKILYTPAKDNVFVIQCDSGTVPTAADIGETANHLSTVGTTASKNSLHELDASDIGTGLQCRIMGIHSVQDNSWGEHVDVEVVFNENVHSAGTASI